MELPFQFIYSLCLIENPILFEFGIFFCINACLCGNNFVYLRSNKSITTKKQNYGLSNYLRFTFNITHLVLHLLLGEKNCKIISVFFYRFLKLFIFIHIGTTKGMDFLKS